MTRADPSSSPLSDEWLMSLSLSCYANIIEIIFEVLADESCTADVFLAVRKAIDWPSLVFFASRSFRSHKIGYELQRVACQSSVHIRTGTQEAITYRETSTSLYNRS